MKNKKLSITALALIALTGTAVAKLPAPSDEAKAKAAEAAAKTSWSNSVASYQLCKSMDSVAAGYQAAAKKSGKEVKPAVATPPCADPGPFVYAPPAPASAASGAASGAAAVVAAAPAAASSAKK
jgi:hypothetical protein